MARRKRNRRHHRRHKASASLGNPRKARRSGRRAANRRSRRGGFSLFNPRRHMNPALEGMAASLLAGGAGYILSKVIGNLADQYLPESIPQKALVGTGVSAVAAAFIAEKYLKDRPKVAAGVTVGTMMPLFEEILKMTPLGPYIGLYESAPMGAGSGVLPAPGGVSASLAANLSAALSDGGSSWASADY